jgi:hypothetical protein
VDYLPTCPFGDLGSAGEVVGVGDGLDSDAAEFADAGPLVGDKSQDHEYEYDLGGLNELFIKGN